MTKISTEQKYMMIDFIEANELLRGGKVSFPTSTKDVQNLWEEVALRLNSCVGARKGWKEWRRSWQDMKGKAKVKAAKLRLEQRTTGGGPPKEEGLTDFQKRVVSLLSESVVYGLDGVEESIIIEDDEDDVSILKEQFAEPIVEIDEIWPDQKIELHTNPSPTIAKTSLTAKLSAKPLPTAKSSRPYIIPVTYPHFSGSSESSLSTTAFSKPSTFTTLVSSSPPPVCHVPISNPSVNSPTLPSISSISPHTVNSNSTSVAPNVTPSNSKALKRRLQSDNTSAKKSLKERRFESAKTWTKSLVNIEEGKLQLKKEQAGLEREKFEFEKEMRLREVVALEQIAAAVDFFVNK